MKRFPSPRCASTIQIIRAGQHVQCRIGYAWPLFTSSRRWQGSNVGLAMNSIPRRFAFAKTSSITGSAPLAPVPTMSRLPPQGIFSSAESGVWPNSSRNCLEGPFFRSALCRRQSPHHAYCASPLPRFRQIWSVVLSYLNVPLTQSPTQLPCDSRLRWCWQRDWNARAQGRFQRMVSVYTRNKKPPRG